MAAGAQLVTANNYGIVPGVGFSEAEMLRHVTTAVVLAKEARDDYAKDRGLSNSPRSAAADRLASGEVLVGCSLPPLVESYRPDLVMADHEGAVKLYRGIVASAAPHADYFIAETLSSVAEMRLAVDGAAVAGGKLLLTSFTLRSDGCLRSGEGAVGAVADVIAHVAGLERGPQLFAVMFNCCEPEAADIAIGQICGEGGASLRQLLTDGNIRLGIAPNRLSPIDPSWTLEGSSEPQAMREDLLPRDFAGTWARKWVGMYGRDMVLGGCCGFGPEHIAAIAEEVGAGRQAR